MSENFYINLPIRENFLDVSNPEFYTAAPPDWTIILTDVRGSTQAIQAGRYKEVNLIGAASIIGILNIAREREIPYVFGGDGATLLIPPSLVEPAKAALLGTKIMAQQEFGLDLRIALAPVGLIVNSGHPIRVARFKVSTNYEQAMLAGSGLGYFEQLVKNPATAVQYQLPEEGIIPQVDYTGLECRWQDVPSQFGETVTLLIMATSREAQTAGQVYRQAIQKIEAVYGQDGSYCPISVNSLNPTYNPSRLMLETKVRAPATFWQRQKYLWRAWGENLIFKYLVKKKVQTETARWDQYLDNLIATSDYRKYDDTLRMIIAGTAVQRQDLTQYLEACYQAGDLVYGLHVSDRALLTCVVFERMGRQVHFVDGADGGYAMAAKGLKERLKKVAK